MTRFLEIKLQPMRPDYKGGRVLEELRRHTPLNPVRVEHRRLYAFDVPLTNEEWEGCIREFVDPVLEEEARSHGGETPSFVYRVGFLPGVTDNEGRTALEMASAITGRLFEEGHVYTSSLYLVFLSRQSFPEKTFLEQWGYTVLANPLIQKIEVFTQEEWKGLPAFSIPAVAGKDHIRVEEIPMASLDDNGLQNLNEERHMALSWAELRAIRAFYSRKEVQKHRQARGLSANPYDAEIEMLAQTWSEHCKHKIFASRITYTDSVQKQTTVVDSLYKTMIKDPTRRFMEKKNPIVSVFEDNAGVIAFNDSYHICYKVETHNSPSALDPYGGAMTGIVGVNRDILGTGKGALPHINVWGYCFGPPDYEAALPSGLLPPRRIREGVHRGVIDGGNQSGIPYGRGWELFDERYLGKPLVYCGTVGLLPRTLHGEDGAFKSVSCGDIIVMAGGRIGKDGIHGATFSSRRLDETSPVQAVQIGDPITQKMMTDFLIEARDKGLFKAITDNGAGGLASSVGEMARETGGAFLDLSLAPLKYHGLQPWEILISEAQERMTLAVAPDKLDDFLALASRREVLCTALGHFTDSGFFHAVHDNRPVCFLEMDFLHDGLPQMELEALSPPQSETDAGLGEQDLKTLLHTLLRSREIASRETLYRSYDHEVKGLSIVKPFTGLGPYIHSDVSVTAVDYDSFEAILLSEGINPWYSDLNPYKGTAAIIDEAVRKAVTAGADPGHMAGLDNFCWPDPVYHPETNPDGKEKLGALVESCRALAHFAPLYGAPCISGKDSMKNDAFLDGKKISIPYTLLFSVIAKVNDYRKTMTPAPVKEGDILYILGITAKELGGSAAFRALNKKGGIVPAPSREGFMDLYRAYHQCAEEGMIQSAHAPSKGGLALSLALQTLAGPLGLDVDLDAFPTDGDLSDTDLLFSESCGRILLTVDPEQAAFFEDALSSFAPARAGRVNKEGLLRFLKNEKEIAAFSKESLMQSYQRSPHVS